ncbi:7110_t:CDS:2 [Dentiscutata erythropus]|uniref:7110_t:CDS:1 n=1 Tax=Dentiscutata erythropus TaxID=1348616 RepID=A0A9N9F0M6_9GLOM|nr:7110_t:CDS:2 [Dentiscutata erythropus]
MIKIELHTDELSQVLCILGGFIICYGLVSYLIKERLYLSEALVSTIVGIILGPVALRILNPSVWGNQTEITHGFTRIVLAIQVMFSGVALPKAYPVKEFKSLMILLFPVLISSWIFSGLLIWWIIPQLTFLGSLALAACITPTDPILSNSVVKGKFAEKHVPPHIRNLLSAESGANDGCATPFLSFAFYLMERESVGPIIGKWILISWLYEIGVAIVVGIGYIARKLLYYSEQK